MGKPIKDKEKIIRDLIDTFKDRDELHLAYKKKMKEIITHAVACFLIELNEGCTLKLEEWVDKYIEERCKPANE